MIYLFPIFLPILFITAEHIDLTLHRHQSCSWNSRSKWNRKVEFERGGKFALQKDEDHPECYSIRGKVRIYEEIDTEIFTFVNVQTSADLHKPGEMCYGANETTGCGGIGSCLYCTSCNSIDEWKGLLGAELLVNDRPLGCDVVEPGHYDNVRLKFCIPRLARFLEMQGIENDAIDHLIASTKNTARGLRLNLFVTVYAFEDDVRPLILSQRNMENEIRRVRGLSSSDPLDSSTHWALPFNKLLHSQSHFIACHKLHATAFIQN